MRRLPPESGQFQLFPYVLELLDEYDFDAPPPPAPRPPPTPLSEDVRLRRLQMLFDGFRWSARSGMTRWGIRTPDTISKPNDTEEIIKYLGADKHLHLQVAARIGGDTSLEKVMQRGTKVVEQPLSAMAPAVLEAIQAAKEEERETARAAAGEGFELLSAVCAERLPA